MTAMIVTVSSLVGSVIGTFAGGLFGLIVLPF